MTELYHYQRKGAHWGERNGPPYPLAPEDHSAAEIKANPDIKRAIKEAKKESKAAKKSNRTISRFVKIASRSSEKSKSKKLTETAKKMSDDELKKANARLQLERQFIDLTRAISPAQAKKESWARTAINEALKKVGTQVATVAISTAANKIASTIAGHDVVLVDPKTGGAPRTVAKKTVESVAKKAVEGIAKTAADKKSEGKVKVVAKSDTTEKPKKEYVPESYKAMPELSPSGEIVWKKPKK